jgi:D-alanine-D-alanine ligase
MSEKKQIAVFCGGRSGEHEVSLRSAKFVVSQFDMEKYDVHVVGIQKNGSWTLLDRENFLINADDPAKVSLAEDGLEVTIRPHAGKTHFFTSKGPLQIDVVFPVLHGTFGEDGTFQGLLDMLEIAYVGADCLSSAAAMDKDVAKRLFMADGMNVLDYVVLVRWVGDPDYEEARRSVEQTLDYPVFVKPAKLGSSVGIAKANDSKELIAALADAWKYDNKILVERGVDAREIECSVLGNEDIFVSELGEIKPHHSFYSYEAKYIDPDGAELVVGVSDIDSKIKAEIRKEAAKAYKALGCTGMARADFFVEKGTNKIYINELNTIPGFTKISMYPKLCEISGISGRELVSRLVELAFERRRILDGLKRDFSLQDPS